MEGIWPFIQFAFICNKTDKFQTQEDYLHIPWKSTSQLQIEKVHCIFELKSTIGSYPFSFVPLLAISILPIYVFFIGFLT